MNKLVLMILVCFGLAQTAQAQSVQRVTSVISGKLSISGSSNRKALSDAALTELCNQGYTVAVFTYPGAKARTVSCGGGRSIRYMSNTSWRSPGSILSTIAPAVTGGGKALVHCWYGVHASRFVAANALIRFCGFSGSQAASWFKKGVPAGSLSPAKINEMASKLSASGGGGSVTGGCPSP